MVRVTQQRKIRPTRKSVSGVYAFRDETPIPYESTLERDLLIKEEFCLGVGDIVAQPVQVPFQASNGNRYIYTPDFLIYRRSQSPHSHDTYPQPLLVEVKPKAEWVKHWRQWSSKWKAATRYAKEKGWRFSIMDEERIRDQAYSNVRFLERYKRMQFPEAESQWVVETVSNRGTVPFHYLLARHFMGQKAVGIAHIWHLLAVRRLDADISLPLSETTELWIPEL